MDLDIPRKEVHVCPIQNSKYKKKSSFCPQPKGKPAYTLHRQGGRRSCSQLLSRLQRHTQANVALNLSVWKSFCIASRFFFHSYPVTSIMNLNLALWYVLGGYASREADWDQRIRWTCIKILLAFKGWRSNPHLLKYLGWILLTSPHHQKMIQLQFFVWHGYHCLLWQCCKANVRRKHL